MLLTGECFCGSISYRITGPLRNARSCHCSRCRKAFSSQSSAYAEVAPGSFSWSCGEDELKTYQSGEGFGLQFCGRCGSTLVGIFEGEVHGITLGCLNEDPRVEIGMHIFTGSKASWERLPEGVVQFDGAPPG